MLRRQPRRPWSSLKRLLLVQAPQLRACTRVSQCVSVNRFVVGSIVGKSCRRAVSRHLAHLLETLAPNMAQFGSAAVARELKLLREPLTSAAVKKLGACYQPRRGKLWQAHSKRLPTIHASMIMRIVPILFLVMTSAFCKRTSENVVSAVFQPTEFTCFSS